jgi:hypothetical protein
MAGSRAPDIARLGRCIGAAALITVIATAPTLAQQHGGTSTAAAGVGAAAHDAGHAPPPAAHASDKAVHEHGGHPPPRTMARRGADRKGEAGRAAPGTNSPIDRRSKLGAPELPQTMLAPAVPQMPRPSARDRLFRLMQTARPKLPARPRPPSQVAPTGPMRNAIGIRIDPAAATPTTMMAHWGQRPLRPATAGTVVAAPPALGNAWHPGAAPVSSARGGLNGTTLVRVGSGAPVIGGPAKTVTGINGTTLRPKHQ